MSTIVTFGAIGSKAAVLADAHPRIGATDRAELISRRHGIFLYKLA